MINHDRLVLMLDIALVYVFMLVFRRFHLFLEVFRLCLRLCLRLCVSENQLSHVYSYLPVYSLR